jgi:hypothetical protein
VKEIKEIKVTCNEEKDNGSFYLNPISCSMIDLPFSKEEEYVKDVKTILTYDICIV